MKEIKKEFARQLRKDQTKAEKIVWEILRNRKLLGLKFRRQHVIEGFVVDFYCKEVKLAIEIDGGIHLKRKDYDRLRQEIIESENIKVIRITNKEVRQNKMSALAKIEKLIKKHIPPLPLGEGGSPESKESSKTRVRAGAPPLPLGEGGSPESKELSKTRVRAWTANSNS